MAPAPAPAAVPWGLCSPASGASDLWRCDLLAPRTPRRHGLRASCPLDRVSGDLLSSPQTLWGRDNPPRPTRIRRLRRRRSGRKIVITVNRPLAVQQVGSGGRLINARTIWPPAAGGLCPPASQDMTARRGGRFAPTRSRDRMATVRLSGHRSLRLALRGGPRPGTPALWRRFDHAPAAARPRLDRSGRPTQDSGYLPGGTNRFSPRQFRFKRGSKPLAQRWQGRFVRSTNRMRRPFRLLPDSAHTSHLGRPRVFGGARRHVGGSASAEAASKPLV